MKTIILDYIGGNKTAEFTDKMLHYADMFEEGKRFAIYKQLTITGNPDLNNLCSNVKSALEQAGEYVLFVSIRNIDGIRTREYKPIFKQGIQTISTINNGKLGWLLFVDMLKTLGYNAETDQQMRVISIN